MPKKSEKEQIISSLIEEAAEAIIFEGELLSDDDAIEDILDDLEENISIAKAHRRGVTHFIPKSDVWCNNVLTAMDEQRIRKLLRVDRQQFSNLINLIKDDEEFNKAHSCKQLSVELQLAIVLFRLGSSGESATFRKIATIFGVGDAGTISKITKRIFKVILKLESKFIYWPDFNERTQIVSDNFSELPFCIGFIDGTEVKLAEAPILDHTTYFSRNHIYAIKAQVVCDYRLRIRHVAIGHPGSWHDERIYRNSSLFKYKENYFSAQQWIAGDSAYPLSECLITPYRSNSKQLDRNTRIEFNLRHSKNRVRIEHCFGILKEKFGSLKELRIRIANKESNKMCCHWIRVCCILHNIFLTNNDEIGDLDLAELSTIDDSIDFPATASNDIGEIKRQALVTLMLK